MPTDAARPGSKVRRTAVRESILAAVLLLALATGCVLTDGAESVFAWAARNERYQIDELLLFLALSHTVMMVFGIRRGTDLQRAFDSRQAAEQQLLHRAQHDPLTGLLSRGSFLQQITLAVRTGPEAAVLLLDVDRFRQVNDTLGHQVGDALVAAMAGRLKAELGGDGQLARVGADVFAVLLAGADADAAGCLAGRLRSAARRPFDLDGILLSVDVSCGIAFSPAHGSSASELLLRADVAMYAAKVEQAGVLTYAAHQEADDTALRTYGELRAAIEGGQLRLHYQPRTALADGRVVAVEALVRWQHPVRGLVPPDDFLPLAERTGLIGALTDVVLDLALTDCRRWRDEGRDLMVAVNLSPRSLSEDDLAERIAGKLALHRLPASCLELEITESAAMSQPGQAVLTLHKLRLLGVALSVDDYGTGHASLAYLKTLPVGTLKIDRSFVQMMEVDPSDRVIVQSTIALGHSLGLRVVAEGVETRAAWNELAALGCDEAQGYWLSRPVPADQLPAVLAQLLDRLVDMAGTPG